MECRYCFADKNEDGTELMECINCGATVCDPCSEECCEEE